MLRLTAAGATAAFLAGCSSDVSRLASGPFGPADNTPTASIGSRTLTPPEAINGAPALAANSAGSWGMPSAPTVSSIQSTPLAPPVAAAAVSRPSTQAVTTAATSAATSAARTAGGSFGPWTTAGGTAVTVAQGESASVLAARYGVPMEALVKANGLTSASQVTPGKSLVVPVYNAAGRSASSALPIAGVATAGVATAAVAAAAVAKGSSATKSVAGAAKTATTATKVVADPKKAVVAAATTQAARVTEPARKVEQKVTTAADASKQRAAEAAKAKKEVAKVEAVKPKETAVKAKEVATAKPAAPAERQQVAAAPAAPAAAAPAADKPEFRWPARGRIIQGFKSGSNDGIAIAVPEGTSVKAAEGGVVAYAGSELKGYGNLVLIRHPNGFVSAYAHNGEINVKRGESVKRGQTIAKSGQSGNVSAPQLHFELRKGSTPVDPTQYLAGI